VKGRFHHHLHQRHRNRQQGHWSRHQTSYRWFIYLAFLDVTIQECSSAPTKWMDLCLYPRLSRKSHSLHNSSRLQWGTFRRTTFSLSSIPDSVARSGSSNHCQNPCSLSFYQSFEHSWNPVSSPCRTTKAPS
jgi:hypothetical protein